jgi:hypothetical protein
MTPQTWTSIGTPGRPWGPDEKKQWLETQTRKRSYADGVTQVVQRLGARFDVEQYGELPYVGARHPLWAIRSRGWSESLPVALITGGVHGYETSGVHGALQFVETRAAQYADRVNLLVLPCISPWAYEHVHRWNPDAVDPNRSFREGTTVVETASVLRLIAPLRGRFLLHVDLHETTDSDESEFRPALAARDGKPHQPGGIPDGFYLVDDAENPQPDFQRAIIEAVSRVTHIAPSDANNQLIGAPVVAPGVINYAVKQLGLCAGITSARYTTTTEVYPDSPRASPEQCNAAQVAAVCAALDFALSPRPAGAP